MMTIRSGAGGMDWAAKGNNRIAQNVRNLINTYRYEIPYHRTMGLPGDLIDKPGNLLVQESRAEVVQMLSVYEPRADVKDVLCTVDSNGNAVIEVVLQ